MQALELIAAVPEGADRVHVEGVLPLAHGGHPLLQPRLVHLLISLLTVVCHTERQYGGHGGQREVNSKVVPDRWCLAHRRGVSSRAWPAPPGSASGRRVVGRWGRRAGTSLTPAAAGCGGTHCGSQALQRRR